MYNNLNQEFVSENLTCPYTMDSANLLKPVDL